jgi:hypothetical protein
MLPQTHRRSNILVFDSVEIMIIAAGIVIAVAIALVF